MTGGDGLAGKAALVVGAAGGIGTAISSSLAMAGCRLVMTDRDQAVQALAGRLEGAAVIRDLGAEGAAEEVVEAAARQLGGLDLLVHAAGVQARGPAMQLSRADWRRLQAVNLDSVLDLARAAARVMTTGRGGAICAVSSMSGTVVLPGIVAYGALKAAVSQLVRGLAVELGPDGVRVNAVAPGYIDTAMTADVLAARGGELLPRIPLGRVGDPADVAATVRFLLSDAAAYVTGAVLPVDGGYSLS